MLSACENFERKKIVKTKIHEGSTKKVFLTAAFTLEEEVKQVSTNTGPKSAA